MSYIYPGHCSRWGLFPHTLSLSLTHTWGYPCTLALTCSHPACIAQRCHFFVVGMQSWRDYFCKPCSASVTSPQEDMEYRMGSCIGVARSQVTPHLSEAAERKTRMSAKTSPAVRWLLVQAEKRGWGGVFVSDWADVRGIWKQKHVFLAVSSHTHTGL